MRVPVVLSASAVAALVLLLISVPLSRGFISVSTAAPTKAQRNICQKRREMPSRLQLASDERNSGPADDFSASDVDDETIGTSQSESSSSAVRYVDAIPTLSSVTDPEAVRLRYELLDLAEATQKGFSSSQSQKDRARDIIYKLANYNPSNDPAMPYYENNNANNPSSGDASSFAAVSLAGKWDLIYTDAPDITSLDTRRNPLATAILGRIGQECNPPNINNVIEWKRPDIFNQLPLPFAGNNDSRILQKVCLKAKASPDRPFVVDLELMGIDLVAPPAAQNKGSNILEAIESEGLPAGILRNNPIELRGPLTAPFGQFEILYLDEEMRIVRTGQNFLAVNLRAREEWF